MEEERELHSCEVCNINYSDKYALARHCKTPSHKKKLTTFEEMAVAKKVRVDEFDGLFTRTEEYLGDVDFGHNQIVRVLSKEALLKPDSKERTVAICEEQLEDGKLALAPKKKIVDILYTASSEHEKGFFRSLPHKNPELAEGVAEDGTPIAGRPEEYNLHVEDLLRMKGDMEARVKALDYEIFRRSKEPRMEALKFIILMFKEEEQDLARHQTQSLDEY
jgi:hypothetical protein